MSKILDTNKPNTVVEYYLGVDEFNHPKVYTDEDATYSLLKKLILLEPGTYPTRPEMGVGLVSKYRYGEADILSTLRDDIKEQIEKYLPRFHNVEVRLLLTKTKELQIEIIMNQIVYAMIYKSDMHTLSELNSLI